ncbi:MAG TPA: hypothetical protein PKO22_10665, partial [Treponemataceae bacterium]|nr:hypothetical protein [Treponemataceae bacterium]
MKRIMCAALGLALGVSLFADAKGDEIAKRYFDLKKADDTKAPASVMTLIDKNGSKKVRKLD